MLVQVNYHLFDTPLGFSGIAWYLPEDSDTSPVVTFFQLPEATKKMTEMRIARNSRGRRASVPPPPIAGIINKVQRHLGGSMQDFRDVAVAINGMSSFAQQVYTACSAIPAGWTMTYGELAKVIQRSTASRAVGQALGRNPVPLIIPCHRVLASGNRPGGFSAHGGPATKMKMLTIEGATIEHPAVIKSRQNILRAAASHI